MISLFKHINQLKYIIGVSSGASALSKYIDALCNNQIHNWFNKTMPMNVTGIAPYPDFLSFAFVMMITGILYQCILLVLLLI